MIAIDCGRPWDKMTKIRMANGDTLEAGEALNEVLDHVFKAKKASQPLFSLEQAHTADRQIWLNPDQISSISPVDES
ncbi:MAG TPA: hypothetical protein VFW48_03890 [Solirubrobacterales bacterium]|nr:hypothetical protein [Solirubrobacterales bacterium]